MSNTEETLDPKGLEAANAVGWECVKFSLEPGEGIDGYDMAPAIRAYLASLQAPAVPVVKELEWQEPCKATNGCWVAESALGTYHVGFDDGWHAGLRDNMDWEWEPENDPRTYEGPRVAQLACQKHFASRIRSALVATPPAQTAAVDGEATTRNGMPDEITVTAEYVWRSLSWIDGLDAHEGPASSENVNDLIAIAREFAKGYAEHAAILKHVIADRERIKGERNAAHECACGGAPSNPYPGWEDEQ